MARIFVCNDTGLRLLMDSAAASLADQGHEVVRGPTNAVGQIRRYSAAESTALMGQVDVAVFTIRHACSRETMQEAALLRGVCFPVIGVETIDLEAAASLGIIIGHGAVPGNVTGMAESTIMLMLMLFYGVQTNIGLLAAGQWRRPGHHGHALEGKTIGLIGFGRIAREVAARLTPFGVRILTSSPRARQADLPPDVTSTDLHSLLAQSDLVSVLTGLTPSTRHLLGAKELALMKPSAYLVNTARGEVIDEAALYLALHRGKIAGAALDTFTVEPLPDTSPLRQLDNVILTPHCVGHTVESWDALEPALLENIRRILAGELPQYCKNPDVEPAWRERLARLNASRAPASEAAAP